MNARSGDARRMPWPELALLAGAVLLTLSGIEGWLRSHGFGDPRPGEQLVQPDLLNMSDQRSVKVEHRTHGVSYSFNNRGFRGRDWAAPKPPGTYRIAMIGDSFVFGIGVGEQETLPAQLEYKVRQTRPGIEVVNLGVYGHNTEQEAILAGRVLPGLEPDFVILVVLSNDVDVMPWNPDAAETCGVPLGAGERLVHALLKNVYLFRLYYSSFVEPGCQSPRRCVMRDERRFDDDGLPARCFARSLSGIAGEARRAGAGVLVFFYPSYQPSWENGEIPAVERVGDEIGKVAVGFGLPYIDGTPLMAIRTWKELLIDVPGDYHPNGRLHEIVAGRMVEFLERYWAGQGAGR